MQYRSKKGIPRGVPFLFLLKSDEAYRKVRMKKNKKVIIKRKGMKTMKITLKDGSVKEYQEAKVYMILQWILAKA